MERTQLLILSTGHLHPLEVKPAEQYAYTHNEFVVLFSTNEDMIAMIREANCVCLAQLLTKMRMEQNADYVLFDSDANVSDELELYDW